MKLEFASFSSDSNESVEFGNRDAIGPSTLPTFTMGSARVLGLSRGALGLYTYDGGPPSGTFREGAMIWVNAPTSGSRLRISDGSGWMNVTVT